MFGNLGTIFNVRKAQSQNLHPMNLKFTSDIIMQRMKDPFMDL